MPRGRGIATIGGSSGKGTVIKTPGFPMQLAKQNMRRKTIKCRIFI